MNVIYMVNNDNVTEINLGKFKNIKKKTDFKLNKQIMEKVSDSNIHINLNTKKAYIVIEGEEIYIKYFKFPKVGENKLFELINNELNYLYRNEKFVFNYKKIRESSENIEVVVFYLRAESLNSINRFLGEQELKAVRLIQLCFLNYYKKFIKEKSYFMFFQYNTTVYMMFIKNSRIYANEVYYSTEDELYSKIKKFFVSNYINDSDVSKVYIVGRCIKNESLIKLFQEHSKVIFLKDIDVNKMTRMII